MTLVVAYCAQDICFMVGDTLVTHEHFQLQGDAGPVNGEFHSLKIQILNGALAIAFAGKFDPAYAAIRTLKALSAEDPDIDPVSWLVEQKGLDECEFLVLSNRKEKELFLIREKKVFPRERAYIGNPDDYDRYTKCRQEYAGPEQRELIEIDGKKTLVSITDGEKEFDVVSDAMERATRDLVGVKHKLVGAVSGFITRVVDARISKELEYLQSVEVSLSPWEPEGGYSVLADNTHSRGLGIYFRAGQRGFIFPVCGNPPCAPSRANSLSEFIKEAREKYGLVLIGGTWP